MGGDVESMVEVRNAYKMLVGKSERKRPLGTLVSRLEIILEWILGK
jgi:hypothetical protein